MEPKKSDKLKKLESLMKQAGMPTGVDAFKSDVFKRVAGIDNVPASKKSASPQSSHSKIKTTRSASPAKTQSYTPNTSLKNEYIIKEYKETLHSLKQKIFSLKDELEELNKKNEKLLKDNQISTALTSEIEGKEIVEKLYNHISSVNEKINNIIVALEEEQTTKNEDKFYSSAILIIEDSITHRKLLKSYFESFNFKNVLEASSIKEALKILDRHAKDPTLPKIKLITVDQNIPGATGLDFLRIFRNKAFYEKLPVYKDIPVIMISGNINKKLIIEGAKLKVNDYIKKPVDKALLAEKVLKWIK